MERVGRDHVPSGRPGPRGRVVQLCRGKRAAGAAVVTPATRHEHPAVGQQRGRVVPAGLDQLSGGSPRSARRVVELGRVQRCPVVVAAYHEHFSVGQQGGRVRRSSIGHAPWPSRIRERGRISRRTPRTDPGHWRRRSVHPPRGRCRLAGPWPSEGSARFHLSGREPAGGTLRIRRSGSRRRRSAPSEPSAALPRVVVRGLNRPPGHRTPTP